MGHKNLDRSRLLAFTLAGALCLPFAAQAQVELKLGVYAYDGPNEVIWSCSAVIDALERQMSQKLDTDVTVLVNLERDYNQGVVSLTDASIDVARFPNVETYWVIHPRLSTDVADAWRESMMALHLEEIAQEGTQKDVGMVASVSTPSQATLTVVEDRFGFCADDVRRVGSGEVAAAARPQSTLPLVAVGRSEDWLKSLALAYRGWQAYSFNELPATASGQPAAPAAETKPKGTRKGHKL